MCEHHGRESHSGQMKKKKNENLMTRLTLYSTEKSAIVLAHVAHGGTGENRL